MYLVRLQQEKGFAWVNPMQVRSVQGYGNQGQSLLHFDKDHYLIVSGELTKVVLELDAALKPASKSPARSPR
jgi:hypothetical protein